MELDFMSIKGERIYRRILAELNECKDNAVELIGHKMSGVDFGRVCGYDNKQVATNFCSRLNHGKAVLTLPQYIALCEYLRIEPAALFNLSYEKDGILSLTDEEKEMLQIFRDQNPEARTALLKLLKSVNVES